MIETVLGYCMSIWDDIACFFNPKRKAIRKMEARKDPFNRMLSIISRELQLMDLETELWQLKRINELKRQIKELEENQGEITEIHERAIYQTNEGVVIKERLIRKLKMEIEKLEALLDKNKKEFPKHRRF